MTLSENFPALFVALIIWFARPKTRASHCAAMFYLFGNLNINGGENTGERSRGRSLADYHLTTSTPPPASVPPLPPFSTQLVSNSRYSRRPSEVETQRKKGQRRGQRKRDEEIAGGSFVEVESNTREVSSTLLRDNFLPLSEFSNPESG